MRFEKIKRKKKSQKMKKRKWLFARTRQNGSNWCRNGHF